jgi:GST-like protein
MYLAEKSGQFWPTEVHKRYDVAQWVMWQMGGLGPMLGQANHFKYVAPEPMPYAVDRYVNETKRLFGILDHRLTDRDYIAGDYSIADMASYSWSTIFTRLDIAIEEFPALQRWQSRMAERPAVQRGMALLADKRQTSPQPVDEKTREILYGKKQFERR